MSYPRGPGSGHVHVGAPAPAESADGFSETVSVLALTDAAKNPVERELSGPRGAADRPRAGLADLLVVTPTYNEAANVPALVEALELARRRAAFDVLIVDDNSPDGTADVVRDLQTGRGWLRLLVRPERAGLGSAYRHGFRWALSHGYGFVGEMDADLSHDPRDVPRLWHAAAGGAALAVGSRYVRGGRTVGWPMRRKALSRSANLYARSLLGLRARDVTSGFRVYRREAVEHLLATSGHCEGYGFQVEGIFSVNRAGWAIAEMPITFRERELGASKMSRAVAIEAARRCLQLARQRLRSRGASTAAGPHPEQGG